MDSAKNLPVAVIGAGPVGLAAAAHLLERGLEPLIFEAGPLRAPPSSNGATSGSSPRGGSTSTPPPSACSRQPAGNHPGPRPCPTAGNSSTST